MALQDVMVNLNWLAWNRLGDTPLVSLLGGWPGIA